ncbi:ABC transporter substrate-binding protein [Azospirillum canadense]|uniref:ABC transporter substrate-binding protein n=1 Tax=Azospirillum canadense TaxID=403962 RepID=UPI00222643CC|nr:ABC transporter substrate-binding protein [Azospirillum canadense]MCW2241181.1 peptide/nickel transport system substrate-binding protein [Azospirillum canadense]
MKTNGFGTGFDGLGLTGDIGRRQLLKTGAAVGLGIGASALLPGASAFAADVPKKGGRLKLGLAGGQTTNTLDQARGGFGSPVERTVNYTLYNTLVEIAPNGQAVPEIAESWDIGPGAKSWVFNIRKDVTFHNGKEMTADDVVHSLRRHMGADTKSGAAGLLKEIESIEKLDKHQVRVQHATGNADLHYLLSDYHLAIVPAETTTVDGVGTGGYVLQTYEPGVRFVAKRNPNYWKEGRAHVDEVEFVVVNDDAARLSALQSGEVHGINRLDPKTVALLGRAPGLRIINSAGTAYYVINMRADRAPFDNKDLRLALKYAINREQMLDRLLRGYGTVGNDHPIAKSMPFFDAKLPQRTQDLDKAKFHFKKSGHSGALDLRTSTAAFSSAIDMAVLLKMQAAEAGIDINVVREPQDGYWENVWRSKEFMISYWTGRAVPDQIFTTAYYSKAAWNDTHWRNDSFDALLLAARTELDSAKRTQMYAEMQAIMQDDSGAIVPMFNNFLDGMRDAVKGDLTASNMELAGCRIAERCWLA